MGEPEAAYGKEEKSESDDVAIVYPAGKDTDYRHGKDCAHPAWTNSDACIESGVSQQLLVEEREQSDEAVDCGSETGDEHATDCKVAVAEDTQVHQRRVTAQFPNDERHE